MTIRFFQAHRSTVALTLLVLLSSVWSPATMAQSTPSHPVVARFLVDIEGLETDFPAPAGGLVPKAIEGVRTARMIKEAVETLQNPEGSPVKVAIDSVYSIVAAALATDRNMHLLPIDTLRGQVPYLLGYPMGNAAEVVGQGSYDGALAIEIYVSVPDQVTGSYSIFGTGKAKAKGHPEMMMRVRMLDRMGRTIWKDRVRVRSKTKVTLDERWVLGLRTDRSVPDANNTLPDLTRQAMAKLQKRSRS